MTLSRSASLMGCHLALVATMLVPGGAYAQQGATVSGTVRSARGDAIQAANVRIANLNVSVGTDAEGFYRITLSPDRVRGQTVTLIVRAIGYKPRTKEITIRAGSQDHEFWLEGEANRGSEVVVTPGDTALGGKRLAFTVNRADTVRSASAPASSDFSQHLFPPELIMQNQSRLNITDAQREAILQEIYKVQATAANVQWRVSSESEKLTALLARDNVSEAQVLEQARQVINFETAVKQAQLLMLVRIRNLLTAEQREILKSFRRREN
jgi:Spy/CpxP family protein refolding chaperone